MDLIIKGVQETIKSIKQDQKQLRFASAVALTRIASQARKDEQQESARKLREGGPPTPFTQRGFAMEKATKANLESSIRILPIQAEYLQWQIKGGTRLGRAKSGEALPVNIAINRYGNIVGRGRGKIKKLIDRPDTFIGLAGRRPRKFGLWQRLYETRTGRIRAAGKSEERNKRSRRLRLIVRFEPKVTYRPRFDFYGVASRTFNKRFEREFDKAIEYALRTARR